MTSLNQGGFRGTGAVVAAVLILCAGGLPAWADVPDNGGTPPAATAPDSPAADSETPPNPREPAPVPQLQIQDEGPPARDADVAHVSRRHLVAVDDTEEKPLWKNWIFWAVTGALVVGAVGMIAYTASGTDTSLAPCPPDIVVSLGCFGSGRGR